MGDQQAQTVSQSQHNAGSSYVGAQVAQSALERRTIKHNQRTREPELLPLPNGKDGKKYRNLTAHLSCLRARSPLISLVCRIRTF